MNFLQAIVFLIVVTNVKCARILAWSTVGTKSHQNVFIPLLDALTKNGHEITFITNYECKLPIRQVLVHELDLKNINFFNYFDNRQQSSWALRIQMLSEMGNFTSYAIKSVYRHEGVKRVLTEKFDLMLINMALVDLFMPLIYTSQPSTPFILISPNNLLTGFSKVFGDFERCDHVPFLLSGFTDRMSFLERVMNTITVSSVNALYTYVAIPRSQALARTYLNNDFPSLDEMVKNTRLAFINTHVSTSYLRPYPPGIIEVGAMHCREAEPLPQDLEDFVSKFSEGFVVFAIGSAIPMDQMDSTLLKALLNTFARLPVGIIWQWKGKPFINMSSNIKLVQWLPQQDLLGHPKIRAFLSHGGLMSLQEAIYHGVPLLGMPLGTDQDMNVNRAVRERYAVRIEWKGLTEEILYDSLTELLSNPTYKQNALRLSSLLRDQPEHPLQRAVFWTEFTLRHEETSYFHSAARELSPWQQALIDVYAFIICIVVFSAMFSFIMVKYVCRRCCNKRKGGHKRKSD